MSGQLDFDGNVGPVSWDGVPLFCAETVAEGLFDVSAFGQLRGQLAMISHHSDCDGYMLRHRVYVVSDRGMHKAFCEECGELHVGSFGRSYSERDVARMYSDHSSEVACDGRCGEWS